MRNQIPHLSPTRLARLLVTVLLLSIVSMAAAQDGPALSFTANPGAIQTGRTRDVAITTESGADLTGFKVQPPAADTGVVFEKVEGTDFQLTNGNKSIIVRIKVDQDADPQTVPIRLVKVQAGAVKESYIVNLLITEFKPRPIQRQPTPPDLKQGETVDAKIQPMSYKATKDDYGRRTADAYYAVAVSLGNNTGFDLQITKLAFITPKVIDMPLVDEAGLPVYENGTPKMRKEFLEVAAIDRTLVRGSVEMEQNFGRRALALNLVGAAGTLSSGFLPFFKAVGPRANFGSFSSLLNGQFKEGFNLAVPDMTIRQLSRLENNLVMHDDFVLPNNSERNTVIFVPRLALDLTKQERDDLMKVREKLGRLVIVGRPIDRFANREIVVRTGASSEPSSSTRAATTTGSDRRTLSNPLFEPLTTTLPPSSTPTLFNITSAVGALDDTNEVTITGNNFTPGAVKLKFGETQTTGAALSATTIKATVPARTTAGAVDVELLIDANQSAKLAGGYTYLDKLAVTQVAPATAPAAGGTIIKISGRGFVSGAQVQIGGVQATEVNVANDHNSITVTLPAHAPGLVDIVVTNPNGKLATLLNGFTYP